MDNISIAENNNLRISETPNAHVQGDPNVVINSNIVHITDDISIKIGRTETLPPNSESYVVNSGDDKNVVLNFGLVRGQRGIDGMNGVDGVDGVDGFSPIATVTQTPTGATITVTDSTQTTTANITNGTDGTDGISPIATVTPTATGATISITDQDGTTTADIDNGIDGFSPIITTTQTASGYDISITDVNGTTTASLFNGTDGTDGTDGFSPIASVTPTATGATISITDQQGTTTANVTNGIDGTDGVTPVITATASVDSLTGTPAVSVTKSGTDENPQFDFAFEHLKGENGKGFIDYSTNEVDTGLKWIDGSTIYRKVFSDTVSISANTMSAINTGTSAKTIINAYGYFDSWHSGSNYNRVAFGQYNGTNIYSSALIRNASYIELQFISSINVSSSYSVVVEYIK